MARVSKSKWPGRHPEPARAWLGLVIGMRGSGKSYRAGQIANGWNGRVLGVDPVASNPPTPDHLAHFCDAWSPTMDGAMVKDAAGVLTMPPGIDLVIVDESDLFIRQGRKPHPVMRDLFVRGRHLKVSLLLLTQRPALIDYTARSQIGFLVCFQIIAREDLRWVRDVHPDMAQVADLLPYLPPGVSVEWDLREGIKPTRAELIAELKARKVKLPEAIAKSGEPANGKQLRLLK